MDKVYSYSRMKIHNVWGAYGKHISSFESAQHHGVGQHLLWTIILCTLLNRITTECKSQNQTRNAQLDAKIYSTNSTTFLTLLIKSQKLSNSNEILVTAFIRGVYGGNKYSLSRATVTYALSLLPIEEWTCHFTKTSSC